MSRDFISMSSASAFIATPALMTLCNFMVRNLNPECVVEQILSGSAFNLLLSASVTPHLNEQDIAMYNLRIRKTVSDVAVSKAIPMFVPIAVVKMPSFLCEYQDRLKYLNVCTPSLNPIRIQWKSKIADAQRVWNKLTKSELLETKGQKFLLVEIIQKRHSTTRDEANKQVNRFFEIHMS
jgi:hypothetical protein